MYPEGAAVCTSSADLVTQRWHSLITGGAGFIGSNLVRCALARAAAADRIVVVDKLTYAGSLLNLEEPLRDPRVRFVQADISDRAAMADAFRDARPDAVLNLAAETHVDRSIDGPRPFIDTNIVGTFVLLEDVAAVCGGARRRRRAVRFRFLHVSTDEVYGTLGPTGLFSEDTPYAPNSPYAASKASADHLVRAYHHTYDLPTLITNCSNNYGAFQYPEKLIPLMILNALDGKPLPIYGDGANVRDWLHVDDHCAGILLVLDKGRAGREVQHRRRQRTDQRGDCRSHLRRAPGAAAALAQSGAARPVELSRSEDVRAGPAGPRSPVRDRRGEDSPRARLGAPSHVRDGTRVDDAVVSRASGLVRSGPVRPLRSAASGAWTTIAGRE